MWASDKRQQGKVRNVGRGKGLTEHISVCHIQHFLKSRIPTDRTHPQGFIRNTKPLVYTPVSWTGVLPNSSSRAPGGIDKSACANIEVECPRTWISGNPSEIAAKMLTSLRSKKNRTFKLSFPCFWQNESSHTPSNPTIIPICRKATLDDLVIDVCCYSGMPSSCFPACFDALGSFVIPGENALLFLVLDRTCWVHWSIQHSMSEGCSGFLSCIMYSVRLSEWAQWKIVPASPTAWNSLSPWVIRWALGKMAILEERW